MAGDIHSDEERLEQLILGQEGFLSEMKAVLLEEEAQDRVLKAVVLTSTKDHINHIPGLEDHRLYDRSGIGRLCMQHRLRFLPAGRFKGGLPSSAIAGLRDLERKAGRPLHGFHILAPARGFRSHRSPIEPLLFVRVGEERYYLIHGPGRQLSPLRRWVVWPFRSAATLVPTVLAIALLLASAVPSDVIASHPEAGWWGWHRVLVMFWCVMFTSAVTAYCWVAGGHRFSREAWNDPDVG